MENIDKKLEDLRESIAENIVLFFHKVKAPQIRFEEPLYISEKGDTEGEFCRIKVLSVSLIEDEIMVEYIENKSMYKDSIECFSVNTLYDLYNKIMQSSYGNCIH